MMNEKKILQEKQAALDAGNAARVQKHQLQSAEEQAAQMHMALDALARQRDAQDAALDEMLAWMEDVSRQEGSAIFSVEPPKLYTGNKVEANIHMTGLVTLTQEDSWEDYLSSVDRYAELEHMDLSTDPYLSLLSKKEQDHLLQTVREDYYEQKPDCDKWDYSISAFCGLVAGLIDSFFVGKPGESSLGKWSDKMADTFVLTVARIKGWNPRSGNESNVDSAIYYLERNFTVNYDQQDSARLGPAAKEIFDMATGNHHLKSLAHSPDLVGLIFSLINQFTGTSSFLDNGRLLTFDTEKQELVGGNVPAKIICAFSNWLMHCISDMAGSHGAKGRGSGLPIPGFELLQFIKIGTTGPKSKKCSFPDFVVEMFENGYDFRFGVAMAVPVAVNEVLVRLCYAIKRYYFHHLPLEDCIPFDTRMGNIETRKPELRRMLLVSTGTLCAVDAGDAFVRSGFFNNKLDFALRLNYFAYLRLATLGLSAIRAKCRRGHIDIAAISADTQKEWQRLYAESQKWETV